MLEAGDGRDGSGDARTPVVGGGAGADITDGESLAVGPGLGTVDVATVDGGVGLLRTGDPEGHEVFTRCEIGNHCRCFA